MSTKPPEIVPIRSDQPFWLESRAVQIPQPEGVKDIVWGFEWVRVPKPGLSFAVQVRTIDPATFEEARKTDDADLRMGLLADKIVVACAYRGELLGADAVPRTRAWEIAGAVFQMSASGLDPFGGPPVASPA